MKKEKITIFIIIIFMIIILAWSINLSKNRDTVESVVNEIDVATLEEVEEYYTNRVNDFSKKNDLNIKKIELYEDDSLIDFETRGKTFSNISLDVELNPIRKYDGVEKVAEYEKYLQKLADDLEKEINDGWEDVENYNSKYLTRLLGLNILVKDDITLLSGESIVKYSFKTSKIANNEEPEFTKLIKTIYKEIDKERNIELIKLGKDTRIYDSNQYIILMDLFTLKNLNKLDDLEDISNRIYESISTDRELLDYIKNLDTDQIVIKYKGQYENRGLNKEYIYKI